MKKITLLLLIILGMVSNTTAQSYPKAPIISYDITSAGVPYLMFITQGKGVLNQYDTVTLKIYNLTKEVYIYKEHDYIDLSTHSEFNMLSPVELINLKQGGIEYLQINSIKYTYTSKARKLQAKGARKYLKIEQLNNNYARSK